MKARLLLLAAVAVATAAFLAPSALAGVGTQVVSVSANGTGTGIIQAFNINCSYFGTGTCVGPTTNTFATGDSVVVTATAGPGSQVASGAMTGCPTTPVYNSAGAVCSFSFLLGTEPDVSINVTFSPAGNTLTVTRGGTGTGTVTSSPAGINCGTNCIASFPNNAQVTLTATPATGSQFSAWGGACATVPATQSCTVTMSQARTVTATFIPRVLYALTVVTAGNGQGTVTSSPAGINCQPTCAAQVTQGTTLTLTPTPAAGSVFTGWSGACTGTQTCAFTMNSALTVTATFSLATVQAQLVGVKTFQTPSRFTRVIVEADQPVKVVCRIVRNGVTLATRTVLNLSGERTLRIPIRRSVASGKAQLRVQFTNQFGTQKTVTRNVKIPPVS